MKYVRPEDSIFSWRWRAWQKGNREPKKTGRHDHVGGGSLENRRLQQTLGAGRGVIGDKGHPRSARDMDVLQADVHVKEDDMDKFSLEEKKNWGKGGKKGERW